MKLEGKLLNSRGERVGDGIVIDDGVVTEIVPVGSEEPSGWLTPGFIDIHNHGGGGASFPDETDVDGVKTAVDAHLELGTTAVIASTVSMIDPMPAIKNLVEACEAGLLLGIHMEGPYISPHKCGAQNPAAIRDPDEAELRSWLEAGKGWIKTMTVAPEIEGAELAARVLLEHGARPSWGHTNASGEETRALLESTGKVAQSFGIHPAQTATHLFNAMPGLAHREPGPIRELLVSARRGETVVELVADAVHLHPDLVSDVVDFVGIDGQKCSVAFVTDAMAGAGMDDGDYILGSLAVKIDGGVARLAEGGAIAGGTARLAEEISRMVSHGLMSVESCVAACVAGPAYALGLTGEEAGVTLDFVVGDRVNLVALGEDLNVTTVIREGEVIRG